MKYELNYIPGELTDDLVIKEIQRVDSIVCKNILTRSLFDKYSKINSSSIVQRFSSWQNALGKAGLKEKYSGRTISDKMIEQKAKKLTNDEIIKELQRISTLVNRKFITVRDIINYSNIMGPAIVGKRFGSWVSGLEQAGLAISPTGRRYSLDKYFENLINVWSSHGRQPLKREMNEHPSSISASSYESRFGSWRNALEAFIKRINQNDKPHFDINENNKHLQAQTIQATKVVDSNLKRHGINLSLRYQVLSRDNFKCVRCGKSPAMNPGVVLHVDHKKPFSRNGLTTIDNLETKCEECNLGKGNRFVE